MAAEGHALLAMEVQDYSFSAEAIHAEGHLALPVGSDFAHGVKDEIWQKPSTYQAGGNFKLVVNYDDDEEKHRWKFKTTSENVGFPDLLSFQDDAPPISGQLEWFNRRTSSALANWIGRVSGESLPLQQVQNDLGTYEQKRIAVAEVFAS